MTITTLRTTRTRPLALAAAAGAALTTVIGVGAPAGATKPGSDASTGTARIFMVNPVQSTGDQTLRDDKDAAGAVPEGAYALAELRNLDGSGRLSGDWANVRTTTGTPAYSPTNDFVFDRDEDGFEQVMAYYWVNQAQEYLQELGFGVDGTGLPAILARPYDVRVGQYGVDNSYMWDKHDYIRLGKGGVDDAEDAEVVVHEYGHAVHHDQVEGFGVGVDAGAIGEAFGDYLAVTVGLDAADRYGWPVAANPACVADWDATSYDPTAPHCLRRVDTTLTLEQRRNQVHFDGMIWSAALWDARQGYQDVGLTTRDWDTTLIAAQFDFAPDTSFSDAARATYLTALERDGAAAAALVRQAFADRGIVFAL